MSILDIKIALFVEVEDKDEGRLITQGHVVEYDRIDIQMARIDVMIEYISYWLATLDCLFSSRKLRI